MLTITNVRNIALAEDDEDDAAIFREVLVDINSNVALWVTVNGVALMTLLSKATVLPDLIFLDVNMPLKNGLECLREIRSNHGWSNIRIIMLSTSALPEQIELAYESGADLYLQKPTSYTAFKHALANCLDTHRPAPQVAGEMIPNNLQSI